MACVVEGLRDALTVVQAAGADPRQFAGLVTQALFPTPVYRYLSGALAKQLLAARETSVDAFIKSALMSAPSASRLIRHASPAHQNPVPLQPRMPPPR